jgi:hypothetical protein
MAYRHCSALAVGVVSLSLRRAAVAWIASRSVALLAGPAGAPNTALAADRDG